MSEQLRPDGAAAASAFDRLFHRLVVAGDRPVVRKKKKMNKKPLAHAPPAPPAPSAPVEVPTHADVVSGKTPSRALADGRCAAAPSRMDPVATASVRRLRLYRNVRRLTRLPRDTVIQRLAVSGFRRKRTDQDQRRQQGRRARRPQLPVAIRTDPQRYMRLEAIAARLYRQRVEAFGDSAPSGCAPSSTCRVLHDFCFASAPAAFQSRIHYERSLSLTTTINVVPVAPSINW